jgi:hypothetical protein
VTNNQLKTLRRVQSRPGIAEHDIGANFDLAGCLRAGLVTRRPDHEGTVRIHLTHRGRAALSASRSRVRSGAFR